MSILSHPENTNCQNMSKNKEVYKSIRYNNFDFMTFENPIFGEVNAIQYVGDTKVWFVSEQIATRLGYASPDKALRHVSPEYKGLEILPSKSGRMTKKNIVASPGVHMMAIRSNKPGAEPFRRWICDDVLESIMVTGEYKDTFNNYKKNMSAVLADIKPVPNCYGNPRFNISNVQFDSDASRVLRDMTIDTRNNLTYALSSVFDTPLEYKEMTNTIYMELFGHTAAELKEMIHFKDNSLDYYENDTLLRNHFSPEALEIINSVEQSITIAVKLRHLLTKAMIIYFASGFKHIFNPTDTIIRYGGVPCAFQLPFRVDTIRNTAKIDIEHGLPHCALYERYFNLRK